MANKRQYMRFNTAGVVTITVEGKPPRSISCDLVDICFGGLGCLFNVATQEQLRENLKVKLELTASLGEGTICGEGTIRYVTPLQRRGKGMFRIGIEFRDINAKAIQGILTRIHEQISAQARKTRIEG